MSVSILRTLTSSATGALAAGDTFNLSLRVPNATPAPLRQVRVTWPQHPSLELLEVDGKPKRRRGAVAVGPIESGAIAATTARFRVAERASDAPLERLALSAEIAVGDEHAVTNEVEVIVARRARVGGSAELAMSPEGIASLRIALENSGDAPAEAVRVTVRTPIGARRLSLASESDGMLVADEYPEEVVLAWRALAAEERATLNVLFEVNAVCALNELRVPRIVVQSRSCVVPAIEVAPVRVPAANFEKSSLDVQEDEFAAEMLLAVKNTGFRPASVEIAIEADDVFGLADGSVYAENVPTGEDSDLETIEAVPLRARVAGGKTIVTVPPIQGGREVTIRAALYRVRPDAGGVRVELRESGSSTPLLQLVKHKPARHTESMWFSVARLGARHVVAPGETVIVDVEAVNTGSRSTPFSVEVRGALSLREPVTAELAPGERASMSIEMVAARVDATTHHDVEIVARYFEREHVIARALIAVLGEPKLIGELYVDSIPIAGETVPIRCRLRNVGSEPAFSVQVELEAHGAEVLDVASPIDVDVAQDVEFTVGTARVHADVGPVVFRARARYLEDPLRADSMVDELGDALDILVFIPRPSIQLRDLSVEHPGNAIVGTLVPMRASLRNAGASAVPTLTMRLDLRSMSFVSGSLRANGQQVMSDSRVLQGLAIDQLASGEEIVLEWLALATQAGSITPSLTVEVQGETLHREAEPLVVALPSAFALGALTLDGSQLRRSSAQGGEDPRGAAEPVAIAPAAATETAGGDPSQNDDAGDRLRDEHREEGAMIDAGRPWVAEVTAPALPAEPVHGDVGGNEHDAYDDGVAFASAPVTTEAQGQAVVDDEPQAIDDVVGSSAPVTTEAQPQAVVDDEPQTVGDAVALADEVDTIDEPLALDADPLPVSSETEEVQRQPVLPDELSEADLHRFLDAGGTDDPLSGAPAAGATNTNGLVFGVDLSTSRLTQAHKYLTAADGAFGDTLALHVVSMRPFLPTRVLDLRARAADDLVTRVRERFELCFDAALSRKSLDPEAQIELESLSARTALVELVKCFSGATLSAFAEPAADRTWGVAVIDPQALRASYVTLDSTQLGDAGAFRALSMFFPHQIIDQGAGHEPRLGLALAGYREALLDVWALYEESAEFDHALGRPAPLHLAERRADLVQAIEVAALVRT